MKLTKTFAALAAASALVIMAATPASATAHSLAVEEGTLTNPVLGTFDFAGGGTPTPPCTNLATDTDTIDIDLTGSTTTVTAVSITSSVTSGTPSTPYMVNITKHTGSNTGTINTTTLAISTNLSLRITFTRAVNTGGTCVSDTGTTTPALVCTVRLDFNGTTTGATPLTGTVTAVPWPVSTRIHTGGLGVFGTALATCGAPFATLLTTTGGNNIATVSSLKLHVYA